MPLDAKVLTFTANTATGDQDLTGTTFTPKGAIAWWSYFTNADATFADGAGIGMGFTDGTTSVSVNATSEDAQGTSDSATFLSSTALITVLNKTGTITTVDGVATFVQWLSNGMRINWSNAPTSAFKLHVLFLGGTDITNVKVGLIDSPGTGASGNMDITAGFAPDLVLFLGGGSNMDFDGTATSDALPFFGAATSSSNQWNQYIGIEDGQNYADTYQYFENSACIVNVYGGYMTAYGRAAYVGPTAGNDGFVINWTSSALYNTGQTAYFAIKGGNFAVGNNTEPGSTGDQTITTNKDTKAVMIFGVNAATAETSTDGCMLTIGGGTSSSEMTCVALEDQDNAGTVINASIYDAGAIYLNIIANATASSSTVEDEASLSSVSSTGFVLNWSNIGNARPFRYITFGSSTAGGELKYGTINESPSISVSESLERLQTIGKTISDTPTVTVSESLARVQTILKEISDTPTVSVSENLVRGLSYPRPITNEPEVSVSAGTLERIQYLIKQITNEPDVTIPAETIAKVAAYPRPISDTPSITVSETLEKILTDIRSITNESSVSIDESLAKYSILPRSISDTPTVSVSESLARIQTIIKLITNEPEVSISALLTGNFLISKIINESPSVSVSETLERIQYLIKLISETPEVTVSELLTGSIPVKSRSITEPSIDTTPTTIERIAIFARSITLTDEPLIGVSDTLARLLLCLRNITNEPEITTSDTAAILALITRTLTEPSTNISEEITRIQSLIKLISDTPVITTSDSVTAGILLIVSLLESRIKWYYSLLTRKIPEGEA